MADQDDVSGDQLRRLADAGVSVWLDNLSRERVSAGSLVKLTTHSSVVGVTMNPTILASALARGEQYDDQVRKLAAAGTSPANAIRAITTGDARDACDLLADLYDSTGGYDGQVSIQIEPSLALDTDGATEQTAELLKIVDRPNVMIKIPATKPGLPAITASIAGGISINVTLIFGLERYRGVIDAYLSGLEKAVANGRDLRTIHSVASFFISRVDAEVDKRLDVLGNEGATMVKGKAALANARLAHALFEEEFGSTRFAALAAKGANPQRLLWASTETENPDLPDTWYVSELIVAGTISMMSERTIRAFADHGEVQGDRVSGTKAAAQQVFDDLAVVGIDLADVVDRLEAEGLEKFDASWAQLVATVMTALEEANKGADSPGSSEDTIVDTDVI